VAEPDLDFSQLFALGEGLRRTALRAHREVPWPAASDLLLGRHRPEAPLEFRRDSGSRLMDLVGTTAVAIKLFSERFVAALSAAGARGWGTYPVRLLDRAGGEVPGYAGLAVSGRAGPLDRGRTRVVALPPVGPGLPVSYEERGMYFDPASWDGTDVFVPEGTTAVCVTDRVRRALTAAGATNLDFVPLSHHLMNLHSAPPPGVPVADD
jgi:hypothetical protein